MNTDIALRKLESDLVEAYREDYNITRRWFVLNRRIQSLKRDYLKVLLHAAQQRGGGS